MILKVISTKFSRNLHRFFWSTEKEGDPFINTWWSTGNKIRQGQQGKGKLQGLPHWKPSH